MVNLSSDWELVKKGVLERYASGRFDHTALRDYLTEDHINSLNKLSSNNNLDINTLSAYLDKLKEEADAAKQRGDNKESEQQNKRADSSVSTSDRAVTPVKRGGTGVVSLAKPTRGKRGKKMKIVPTALKSAVFLPMVFAQNISAHKLLSIKYRRGKLNKKFLSVYKAVLRILNPVTGRRLKGRIAEADEKIAELERVNVVLKRALKSLKAVKSRVRVNPDLRKKLEVLGKQNGSVHEMLSFRRRLVTAWHSLTGTVRLGGGNVGRRYRRGVAVRRKMAFKSLVAEFQDDVRNDNDNDNWLAISQGLHAARIIDDLVDTGKLTERVADESAAADHLVSLVARDNADDADIREDAKQALEEVRTAIKDVKQKVEKLQSDEDAKQALEEVRAEIEGVGRKIGELQSDEDAKQALEEVRAEIKDVKQRMGELQSGQVATQELIRTLKQGQPVSGTNVAPPQSSHAPSSSAPSTSSSSVSSPPPPSPGPPPPSENPVITRVKKIGGVCSLSGKEKEPGVADEIRLFAEMWEKNMREKEAKEGKPVDRESTIRQAKLTGKSTTTIGDIAKAVKSARESGAKK